MLALNYRDSQPIYSQIKDGLRRLIVGGALEPGEKLPTVRDMSMDLAINPKAIARAYSELEREGFIRAVPGEGGGTALYAAGFARAADGGPDEAKREELMARLRGLIAQLRELGVSGEELSAVIAEGGAK